MKFRKVIIDQVKELPFFSKEVFRQLCSKHGLALSTVDSYIHKALKQGEIISLKRGLYVTKDFYEKNISDIGYTFFLANILWKPSYVSSWAALDYYGMTTDVIATITSVTTRRTKTYFNKRKFNKKIGGFIYNSIKKDLFKDFKAIKSRNGFKFFIATPPKALFDLLYLRTNRFRRPKKNILEDLRIDIDEMGKSEIKKLKRLFKDNHVSWKIL